MSQRTINVCDVCGAEERQEGPRQPPAWLEGWATLNVRRNPKGNPAQRAPQFRIRPDPAAPGEMIASFQPMGPGMMRARLAGASVNLMLCSGCADHVVITVAGKVVELLRDEEDDGFPYPPIG